MTASFECEPTILRVQRPRPDGTTLVIEAGQVYETADPREIADLDQAPGLRRASGPGPPDPKPKKR